MSKSIGNTIYPKDVIEKYGADILRLWVSSVDYREDVKEYLRIYYNKCQMHIEELEIQRDS